MSLYIYIHYKCLSVFFKHVTERKVLYKIHQYFGIVKHFSLKMFFNNGIKMILFFEKYERTMSIKSTIKNDSLGSSMQL